MGLCALAPGLALAAPTVSIAVEKVPDGPPVAWISVEGGPVSLPACRGISWERFDAESGAYLPLDVAPCGALSAARVLGPDPIEAPAPAAPVGQQVWRVVVVYAQGCAPDTPFPLAGCGEIQTAMGDPVPLTGG